MGRERDCSRPFYFPCGCDLTATMPPRHGGCPGATPGSRTSLRLSRRWLSLTASRFRLGRPILWKAGRYKLAAPVLKTGSVTTEVGALPTPSATLTIKNKGAADETHNQKPKSVASAKELQSKPNSSNPTGQNAVCFLPGAFRSKTKDHRL